MPLPNSQLATNDCGRDQENEQHDQTSQVGAFLAGCNLSQYCSVFIDEGFDQLNALFEVTEMDLEQMGVKRGHRRLIQRAIANAKTNSSSTSVFNSIVRDPVDHYNLHVQLLDATPLPPPVVMSHRASVSSVSGAHSSGMSSNEDDTVTSENIARCWKRKYQRHATPDINSPVKPPSAYVMFCNNLRTELKDKNLSFPVFAKIAGVRWKNLGVSDKLFYERQAQRAKDEYRLALDQYQQTEGYRQYQQYLSDFREKHEAAAHAVGKPNKRTKRNRTSSWSDMIRLSSPEPPPLMGQQQERQEQGQDKQQQQQQQQQQQPAAMRTGYPYWLLNDNQDPPVGSRSTNSNDNSNTSNTCASTSATI